MKTHEDVADAIGDAMTFDYTFTVDYDRGRYVVSVDQDSVLTAESVIRHLKDGGKLPQWLSVDVVNYGS
jgi:hypothetical protein